MVASCFALSPLESLRWSSYVPMMHAVHERLNDLQSIYQDDLEIVARAMTAAIGTAKGKSDKSGSRHG